MRWLLVIFQLLDIRPESIPAAFPDPVKKLFPNILKQNTVMRLLQSMSGITGMEGIISIRFRTCRGCWPVKDFSSEEMET